MTRKLAERVVAWRWYIIAGWIVLGALLVVLAPSLNNFTSSGYGLPASYQSTQAETIALKDFPSVASASGIIAVNARDNSALTAADLQKIDALTTALDGDHIDSVRSVTTSPLFLSKNQKIQLVEVTMTGQPGDDGPNAAVTTLRSDTDAFLDGLGVAGPAHRERRHLGRSGQRVRPGREDHLDRHRPADPVPAGAGLPQRDHRLPAPARRRSGAPDGPVPDRLLRPVVRVLGRHGARAPADRRDVRRRHGLHRVHAVPLPRADWERGRTRTRA